MAQLITKNSVIGMSLTTLIATVLGIWSFSGKAQSYITQIGLNTQAIQAVVQSLELSRVDRQIEGLKSERREINREIRGDPANSLLLDQLDEINDSIETELLKRQCIEDPAKEVCE